MNLLSWTITFLYELIIIIAQLILSEMWILIIKHRRKH